MVRATFAGFSTALSALQANQKRLDITGQNLANMNTVGYTRQQLQTSSINHTHPVSHYMSQDTPIVGYGVHMDAVTQIRDPFLDAQYRNQIRNSGYTDSIQSSLDSLSKVFDESQINGIRNAFNDIQSVLTDGLQDPAKVNDPIFESEMRNRMQALTNLLNDASRKITEAEKEEYAKLSGAGADDSLGAVDQINNMLMQIGNLNRQIKNNQIAGQPALELMDERNVLLDELASYIPIEVTYYKDASHDGIKAKTDADGNVVYTTDDGTEVTKQPDGTYQDKDGNTVAVDESKLKLVSDTAEGEIYHRDGNGNVVARREWPDDLRVEMIYQDENGKTQRLTLVEGTIGKDKDNYGQLSMGVIDSKGNKVFEPNVNFNAEDQEPKNVFLSFQGIEKYDALTNTRPGKTASADFTRTNNGTTATISNHFADGAGSVQANLDMLWKDGKTTGIDDVRGYEYYRNQLDNLARSFATVMNTININGSVGTDKSNFLLANKDNDKLGTNDGYNFDNPNASGITAANIGISKGWISGSVHISTADVNNEGNATSTVLNMLEAMSATYPYNKFQYGNADLNQNGSKEVDLEGNSFSDYMNYTSTVLATDSLNNTMALKTNVTVLNGIQNSRDSISGVSLDEEASNMMAYISAYNAASRLMTTLDEALNILMSTGVVGR